jgi:O-antigen ligase
MDNQNQSTTSPIWLLTIYIIMIGFTFISMPNNETTYVATRGIQAIELVIFATLIVQLYRQGIRTSKFNSVVNIWWMLYLFLTYSFASGMGLTPMFQWLNIVIYLLLGSCYWKNNFEENLRFIAGALSVLIYANAILLVMYPDGLWIDHEWVGGGDPRRFLFGNYNHMGFVCLLGTTAQAMYTFATKRGRFKLFLLLVVSLGTVLYVGSMTSTVGLGMLTIYILIHNFIKRPRLLLTIFVIIYIAFFLVIVWAGNSIEEIDLMTRFIENVLSKDTTFTKRTDIWSNAIYKIQQSPWLGYGVQNTDWNITHLNASGPHNLLLMLLLQGGVVLCGAFIYLVGVVVRKALNAGTTIGVLAVVSICIFFTMSLFEAYNILQTFFLLQLAYYSSLLQPNTIEAESTQSQIES